MIHTPAAPVPLEVALIRRFSTRHFSQWLCLPSFLTAFVLFATLAFAEAPPQPDVPIPQKIETISTALQKVETALQNLNLTDSALADLRNETEPLATELQQIMERLEPALAAYKTRLDQLGAKPDEKSAPESPAVTADREEQQTGYNKADALIKRTKLLIVQTDQAVNRIAARRQNLFTQSLFQSTSGIASPSLWINVAQEAGSDFQNVQYLFSYWFSNVNAQLRGWRMPVFWSLVGLTFVLYWPIAILARKVSSREPTNTNPSRLQKIRAAWWITFVIASVPIIATFIVAMLAELFDVTNDRMAPFMRALGDGVARVALAGALARGLFAPTRPNWRLFSLSNIKCERIEALALVIATVVSITKMFEALNEIVASKLPVSIAVHGIGALVVAIFIALYLARDAAANTGDDCLGPVVTMSNQFTQILRLFAWAVVFIIVVAVLAGYIALASFIVDQILWAGGVTAIFFMAMVMIDELIAASMKPQARFSHALSVNIGIERQSLNLLSVLLSGLNHAVLFILAGLLILAPWGVQSTDVPSGLRAVLFGLKIGDITLSMSGLASALTLFAVCYGATHVVTRWLENSFLPQTKLDLGLRNSIKTSVGYLGFTIALFLSLGYIGLNFEKLAIVAGALSVGIGFGLQAIFNNFVSGLILLWERAVRVGDWIVIGGEEGVVRRINVRATEIETFDRALVVIPNGNLMNGIVKNWVRTGRTGRLKIALPLTLAADPVKVRSLLLDCAQAHPLIFKEPAPQVFFTSLSPTALNFELYCFVGDVSTITQVKSDLYFDIFKRFGEEGLEIAPAAGPTLVTLTGLDDLSSLLQGRETRSNGALPDEKE